MASYFDSVRNPSTFTQKAKSEKFQDLDFNSLHYAKEKPTPVSSWGREHLFALRVLCAATTVYLPALKEYLLQSDGTRFEPQLQALVDGPGLSNAALAAMSEPHIVGSYEKDSLGSVTLGSPSLVSTETHQPIQRLGNPVPSASIQIGSSPPPGARPPSASTIGSVGYTENPQVPAVEDLTHRLASCFVRHVLNYGQRLNTPILEFRDERLTVHYELKTGSKSSIEAVDDGGVRLFQGNGLETLRAALLEAKRCFQVIDEGRPVVSDGLLAQMVGQALLSLLDESHRAVSTSRVITIHATRHYVKFFSFEPSDSYYLTNFESLPPRDDSDLFFWVESSEWFDITTAEGRKMVVRHLLALVQWAHERPDEDVDVMEFE